MLMLLSLSLGAQNLERPQDREALRLGFGQETVPLPTGVVVGLGLIAGVLAGGSCSALLLPGPQRRDHR